MESASPVRLGPPDVTAKVVVRHSVKCRDRERGLFHRGCNCRKSLLLYDGVTKNKDGKLTNRVVSAKTRSWEKAEKARQDWLDTFDPDKIELKQLRAKRELWAVRIEDAVHQFDADLMGRGITSGTVALYRTMLGRVHPDTKQIVRRGHLFSWLDQQDPRPTFIADLTPPLVNAWRASWKFSDTTKKDRWTKVKEFFQFCENMGFVPRSPAENLSKLKVTKGSRTGIFSDDQYEKILAAVTGDQRLLIFLELMRWSGMDTIDAAKFSPSQVSDDGVLRYARQKTGIKAVVPLPEDVVISLRDIPLAPTSIGPDQPFRSRHLTPAADARKWRNALCVLFKDAGITEVTTDVRRRKPHTKMLRDTFAVHHLCNGVPLHSISRMLGHSNTKQTEAAYLPWVAEMENAHITAVRKTMKPRRKRAGVVRIA